MIFPPAIITEKQINPTSNIINSGSAFIKLASFSTFIPSFVFPFPQRLKKLCCPGGKTSKTTNDVITIPAPIKAPIADRGRISSLNIISNVINFLFVVVNALECFAPSLIILLVGLPSDLE